jgi:hypothetical protein
VRRLLIVPAAVLHNVVECVESEKSRVLVAQVGEMYVNGRASENTEIIR